MLVRRVSSFRIHVAAEIGQRWPTEPDAGQQPPTGADGMRLELTNVAPRCHGGQPRWAMALSEQERKWIGLAVATLAAVALGLAIAWWRVDWDVTQTGMQGDSLAPISALISLAAVLAALRSLGLQREALNDQRIALAEQQVALHRDFLHERQSVLGTKYAALFGAIEIYRAHLLTYCRWLRKNSTADRDRRGNEAQRLELSSHYEDVLRANWEVLLVDTNSVRTKLRADLIRRPLTEVPQGTADNDNELRRVYNGMIEWSKGVNAPARDLVLNLSKEFSPEVALHDMPEQVFALITDDPSLLPIVE